MIWSVFHACDLFERIPSRASLLQNLRILFLFGDVHDDARILPAGFRP